MPTPAPPDDAAAGETQRPSFIPLDVQAVTNYLNQRENLTDAARMASETMRLPASDFPALLGALFGRPVPTETEQEPVRTWTFTPRVTREPGDDLPTLHFDPHLRPMFAYEEFRALPSGVERAAIDGAWGMSAEAGIEYGRALADGIARGLEQGRALTTPSASLRPDIPTAHRELIRETCRTRTERPIHLAAGDSVGLRLGVPVASGETFYCVSYTATMAEAFILADHADWIAAQIVPDAEYTARQAAAAQWQRDRAAAYEAAEARAEALLLSLLTPRQRREYEETHEIPVRGSDKRRYRISHGRVSNVRELNRAGMEIASWCAAPQGTLPIADIMAAQLLWLRADAEGFRAVANPTYYDYIPRRRNRRAQPAPEPTLTLRLDADPLPDMEPGRITRTLYDSDRVSGQWLVGGPTRWIYP